MIPDYKTLTLPVLKAANQQAVQTQAVIQRLADEFGMSAEEREHLLPSGKQRTFDNRINWAKSYLKQAGLSTHPRRGRFLVTNEGRQVVSQNPDHIDANFIMAFEAFGAFRSRRHTGEVESDVAEFFGALNPKKAPKGIFFTTASFSLSAIQTAGDLSTRIVLIDGEQLSDLMIKYGVGCRVEEVLDLKKIDDEFF